MTFNLSNDINLNLKKQVQENFIEGGGKLPMREKQAYLYTKFLTQIKFTVQPTRAHDVLSYHLK